MVYIRYNTKEINTGFYFWKSEFELSSQQKELLRETGSNRLYIHFFDVDLEAGKPEATPKAVIHFNDSLPSYTEIIPVIYVAQKVFNKIDENGSRQLAHRIVNMSKQISGANKLKWKEFQIDCDWTAGNKNSYFEFLNYIKDELPEGTLLSCTIRLHQVKYPEKTGVPPVERGVLMFYNMGEIKTFDTKNSIYNYEVSEKYLECLSDYPLKLDFALATYGWLLHYRLNKLQEILPESELRQIEYCKLFTHVGNTHVCNNSGFCDERYFMKGDVVEFEHSDFELCGQAALQLKKHINSEDFNIIFYHLSSDELSLYDADKIKSIRNIFN
ncbi:MAG: hypothetical protein R2850_13560 [Bacteroidia bacterium]